MPITKPTKFAQIIVPDNSFWNENGIEMHRKMIDFITSKITPVKSQALYLSRRRFDKACSLEFGEEYFEQIYAKKGYKIVYPETLSPSEQLSRVLQNPPKSCKLFCDKMPVMSAKKAQKNDFFIDKLNLALKVCFVILRLP